MHAGVGVIGVGGGVGLEGFAADVGATRSIGLGRDGGGCRVAVCVVVDHPHVGLPAHLTYF